MVKLQRSKIISEQIGSGVPLEEIDMTEIDSAFSDRLIEEEYFKMISLLPKSSEIRSADVLSFDNKLWEKVNYQVPL